MKLIDQIKNELRMKAMKGQITIIAIIITVITVMVFAAVLPLLNDAIAMVVANTNSTSLQAVVQLYPLFLALGIVIAILTYTTVQRPAE